MLGIRKHLPDLNMTGVIRELENLSEYQINETSDCCSGRMPKRRSHDCYKLKQQKLKELGPGKAYFVSTVRQEQFCALRTTDNNRALALTDLMFCCSNHLTIQ